MYVAVNLMKITDPRGLITLSAVFLRCLIGFFPYSGENEPPRYGDYEAQRHWKELTFNLPMNEWYSHSSRNDPTWWPLDYPPLTAYHEWVLGLISSAYEPSSVILDESRGYETETHRMFMRLTVLLSDLLVYFPAAWKLSSTVGPKWKTVTFIALLLNPALIFVDHAHFQYNSVAVGLLLWAVYFIQSGRPYAAAMAYTAAFLFKQTMLYFSPMFFTFMLAEALHLKSWKACARRVSLLGLTVIGTVLSSCLPLLYDCDDLGCAGDRLVLMVKRIFPFGRGVFEDYVANAWIVLNPLLRIRNASEAYLRIIGSVSTVLSILGATVPGLPFVRAPRRPLFAVGLAASALSFYLFSWMVHEKAIILPLTVLLASIGVLSSHKLSGSLLLRVVEASFLTLLPLMKIEGSMIGGLAVFGVSWLTLWSFETSPVEQSCLLSLDGCQRVANGFSAIGAAVMVSDFRPERFPFIGELVIMSGAFVTLIMTWWVLVGILFRSDRMTVK